MEKDLVLEKVNANEVCNSQCVNTQECAGMWSIGQFTAYEKLSIKNTRVKTGGVMGTLNMPTYRSLEKNEMKFDDDPLSRIKKIAQEYAKTYLEQGDGGDKAKLGRFFWMGLGAIAAKQVYCGILAIDDMGVKLSPKFASGISNEELRYTRAAMLKGNLWLYMDIYPWHWYYKHYPQSFSSCLPQRDARKYHSKVAKALQTIPYHSALPQLSHFKYAQNQYIRKGFQKIKEYEDACKSGASIDNLISLQLESLVAIADHEQRVVLQNCFYAPNGVVDSKLKQVFDRQKKLETDRDWLLAIGSWVSDVQRRQAVYTNTCVLPKKLKGHPDEDKFYEDMTKDENLYDVEQRMDFITRIAEEFSFVMEKYQAMMHDYIGQLAKGNIEKS